MTSCRHASLSRCLIAILSVSLFPLTDAIPVTAADAIEYAYPAGIDALSAALPSKDATAEVSYYNGTWSAWKTLRVEDEQDPRLLESNLVTFPDGITRIRVRGRALLHPVTVPHAPVTYEVAAAGDLPAKRILSRKDWGADESLLYATALPSSSATHDQGDSGERTDRERECDDLQRLFPNEFHTPPAVTVDGNGKRLRWAHTYSTEVKMLVVHHTASPTDTETRPGAERMRALYTYHAKNRGWGDIGYHYVIDETGKIYEGKSGGDFVVGGHAYCNNIGTIGVALMGNFDDAPPTQAQTASLQWLLTSLGERYKIDLSKPVTYHGKRMPAIAGHRQLLQTDCPGEYLFGALDQVRMHAASGRWDSTVAYATGPRRVASSSRRAASSVARSAMPSGFTAMGPTEIEGRPGGSVVIPVLFKAGTKAVDRGGILGSITRQSMALTVSEEKNGQWVTVRKGITAPSRIAQGTSMMIRLKVELPADRGSHTLKIGSLSYVLSAAGRRVRGTVTSSYLPDTTATLASGDTIAASSSSSRSRAASSAAAPPSSPLIRIRLHDSSAFTEATLSTGGEALVDGTHFPGAALTLRINGTRCEAAEAGRTKSATALRIVPAAGETTITSWKNRFNRYGGIIECRVIGGQLVLINELPLEEYLEGLAEEPDTEPAEKQKAFAIAARTYAAWYMDPNHRKFPGLPYDGSDSPAEFQIYSGKVFAEQNPRWIQSLHATAGEVLTVDGQVIKPPYFSQSDGRTRDPSEAGWKNFPHAEIFASKPDPWCQGMQRRGHGVGMSGCGAEAQANEGRTYREILGYYYPGAEITVQ